MRKFILLTAFGWQLAFYCWGVPLTTAPRHHGTTALFTIATSLRSSQQGSPVSYDSLWHQVDSLSHSGLPRSALIIVDQLYIRAMNEANDPQLVKSIIYRISLNSTFRENFQVEAISELKKEIETSREPVTQILNSILGELYYNYYQRNQYRFSERSAMIGYLSDNPETWDAKRLLYEVILSYRNRCRTKPNFRRSLWSNTGQSWNTRF